VSIKIREKPDREFKKEIGVLVRRAGVSGGCRDGFLEMEAARLKEAYGRIFVARVTECWPRWTSEI
jgi:hypothetical protein